MLPQVFPLQFNHLLALFRDSSTGVTQGFKELRFSKPSSMTPVTGYLMNLLNELDLLFKTKMTLQPRMRK